MPSLRDTVRKYAQLSYVAELYTKQGAAAPAQVAKEMLDIETEAFARIPPDVLSGIRNVIASDKFEFARQQVLRVENQKQTDLNNANEKWARDVTKGMFGQRDGLTVDQFQELRDTGKVTFPSTKIDPKQADEVTRASTRHLDPAGQGWSKREWVKRLDALTEARQKRDDREFDRLSQGIRLDKKALAKAADDWATQRITFGLKERNDARSSGKDEVVEADEHARRKMAVTDAYLAQVEEDKIPSDHFYSEIPSHYMKDEGLRGDVARAFEAHEKGVPLSVVQDAWK